MMTAPDPVAFGLPAEPLTAATADPPAVHLRARLDGQVRALLEHGAVALADEDPEGVHQLRVTVRRLRAVLKAEAGGLEGVDDLRVELKWFFGELGPVRDLDVLLDHFHAEAVGFSPAELGALGRLLAGLAAERERARKRAARALRSKRYGRLLRTLAAAATSRPPKGAATVRAEKNLLAEIDRPHRRLRKAVAAMGADPADPADQELHDLRILGKKLRYAAELAAPVGGKRVRRLVRATKELQDVLGEHQDACIAETRVRALVLAVTEPDEAFVAGRLVERERVRQDAVRAVWRGVFEEVDECAGALARP